MLAARIAVNHASAACSKANTSCPCVLSSVTCSGLQRQLWGQQQQRLSEKQRLWPCRAAALDVPPVTAGPANLSTYQLRSTPRSCWSHMWFEAVVQTVVKQLDGQPFLVRVNARPQLQLNLIRLAASELSRGWDYVHHKYLSSGNAYDAVILVHPVAAEQPCVVRHVQGRPCSDCMYNPAASSSSCEQVLLMDGKIGDCCDGQYTAAGHQNHTGSPNGKHSSSSQQQQQQRARDSHTAYYGLVVQCKEANDHLQGCYLLKTMQVKQHLSRSSVCHCTHYSVNRVCQGPSLQHQFKAAWLV
eukprot:GHRR01000787.1.p1 GENE.GHRR01000787.1~~GHRR01000787.1.p1  ORF type:complete len:300 (+),score=57.89 GHRR01000787.1:241-1140(+)